MTVKLLSGGSGGRGRGYTAGWGSWLGTNNYVVKSGVTALVNSNIYDDGNNVGIGIAPATTKLQVRGTASTVQAMVQNTQTSGSSYAAFRLVSGTTNSSGLRLYSATATPSGGIYPLGTYIYNSIADGSISIWGEASGSKLYFGTNNILRMTIDNLGNVNLSNVSVYANNAAAIAGGLTVGTIYRTGGDPDTLCIVH